MPALDAAQQAMMRAIDLGPDFAPHDLFSAIPERVMLGLRVHANTISHARLVALEDTFPRTREWLGHQRFNTLCRDYTESLFARALPLTRIGAQFPDWLARLADGEGLARLEWLWLEAYHAADEPPLVLGELAGIDPDELLGLKVARHHAAHAVLVGSAIRQAIGPEVPGLGYAEAALIVRPDAEVLIVPASRHMHDLLARARNPLSIGNLLGAGSEPDGMDQPCPDDAMQALVALLDAGALRKAA